MADISLPASPPTTPSKRSISELGVMDTLHRMENELLGQRKFLEQMMNSKDGYTDFETMFAKLLDSYSQLSQEERTAKIRKVLDQPGIYSLSFNDFLVDCASLVNTAVAAVAVPAENVVPIIEKSTQVTEVFLQN